MLDAWYNVPVSNLNEIVSAYLPCVQIKVDNFPQLLGCYFMIVMNQCVWFVYSLEKAGHC